MTNRARTWGAALAALFLTCEQTRSADCVIVTDGSLAVYMHELAHCNGWNHPTFEAGHEPPAEYVHDFTDGKLTVYQTGQDYVEQMGVMTFAQMDARFIMTTKTPPQLCAMLWRQHRIFAAQKDVDNVIGCAVR